MNYKKRTRGPKVDNVKLPARRVTDTILVKVTEEYERLMVKSGNRDEVLETLGKQYGRDKRTIERWISQGRTLTYKKEIKRIEEPLILEAKRRHFNQLAEIISILLSNDLHKVYPNININKEDLPHRDKYMVGAGEGSYGILDDSILSEKLQANLQNARQVHNFTTNCLESHINAEIGEVEPRGAYSLILSNPYRLIEILRLRNYIKMFEGTCPVCKDW
jgi:hypothetical protein